MTSFGDALVVTVATVLAVVAVRCLAFTVLITAVQAEWRWLASSERVLTIFAGPGWRGNSGARGFVVRAWDIELLGGGVGGGVKIVREAIRGGARFILGILVVGLVAALLAKVATAVILSSGRRRGGSD